MDLARTLEHLSLADLSTAQHWVRAIHTAFYAPTVCGQSGNKFLELEATLTQVLTTKLHEQQQCQSGGNEDTGGPDELWAFMVRVVLRLAQEPVVTDPASAAGGEDNVETLAARDTQQPAMLLLDIAQEGAETRRTVGKKTPKKPKKSAQPYAPLAFVVVNALKKLVDASGGETAQSFREHGRMNGDLAAFCLDGFARPEEVVSATACERFRRQTPSLSHTHSPLFRSMSSGSKTACGSHRSLPPRAL